LDIETEEEKEAQMSVEDENQPLFKLKSNMKTS
jgi:hypothetical protein